jgi:hypothetical protein
MGQIYGRCRYLGSIYQTVSPIGLNDELVDLLYPLGVAIPCNPRVLLVPIIIPRVPMNLVALATLEYRGVYVFCFGAEIVSRVPRVIRAGAFCA